MTNMDNKYIVENIPNKQDKEITIVDYPENDQLLNGLPLNTIFQYVSSTYIAGLVNFIEIKQIFIDFKEKDNINKKLITELNKDYHGNYDKLDNFIIIVGESEDSYWIIIRNPDVSDCIIGRYAKKYRSYEEFYESIQETYLQLDSQTIFPLDLKPHGWICL